ncbi:MAG TPA: hypothetical protein PKY87_14580 [Terricaulis sp.]|nr:hypothetical protein [Terricaulis sp.]
MNPALHILLAVFVALICIGAAVNPFMALLFGAFIEALALQIQANPLAWLLWFGALACFCVGLHELLEQRTLRGTLAYCAAAGAIGWLFALAGQA